MTNANPDIFDPVKSKNVPFLDVEMKYPFYHQNNKLAISYWALPKICKFSTNRFQSLLSQRNWKEFLKEEKNQNKIDEFLLYSKVFVLTNPDNYSSWNQLKECALKNIISLQDSLSLVRLALSKNAKSGCTWSHLKFILTKMLKENQKIDFFKEIAFCLKCSSHYPKNYHSWTHKIWLIKLMNEKERYQMIKTQLREQMKEYLQKHISDNCVYQFRFFLLLSLLNENSSDDNFEIFKEKFKNNKHFELVLKGDFEILLLEEFDLLKKILINYPGHESSWLHFRNLLLISLKIRLERISSLFFEFIQEEKKKSNQNLQFILRISVYIDLIQNNSLVNQRESLSLLKELSYLQIWKNFHK